MEKLEVHEWTFVVTYQPYAWMQWVDVRYAAAVYNCWTSCM